LSVAFETTKGESEFIKCMLSTVAEWRMPEVMREPTSLCYIGCERVLQAGPRSSHYAFRHPECELSDLDRVRQPVVQQRQLR